MTTDENLALTRSSGRGQDECRQSRLHPEDTEAVRVCARNGKELTFLRIDAHIVQSVRNEDSGSGPHEGGNRGACVRWRNKQRVVQGNRSTSDQVGSSACAG